MAYHLATVVRRAWFIVLLGLVACTEPPKTEAPLPPQDLSGITREWQASQIEHFRILSLEAGQLQRAVSTYIDNPSTESQLRAQEAWKLTHASFVAYRPFVAADDYLHRVDAWPIEPGFLDSIAGYPDSGIVNDETLVMDAATVIAQHGFTDSSEASLGLHPLEFLLFDRDPGQIVPGDRFNDRRRQLLMLLSALFRDDIGEAPVMAMNDDNHEENLRIALQRLTSESERLFVEATQFVEGHGFLSKTQFASMVHSMTTIESLAGDSSALFPVLKSIDPTAASDLKTTLAMTREVLGGDLSEDELARLPLLMAAIGHQFDDLQRAMALPD